MNTIPVIVMILIVICIFAIIVIIFCRIFPTSTMRTASRFLKDFFTFLPITAIIKALCDLRNNQSPNNQKR